MRKVSIAVLTTVVAALSVAFLISGGPSSAAAAIPELGVTGSATGGVTTVEKDGHLVPLQFTLTNHGPGSTLPEQDAQLILTSLTGATLIDVYCVSAHIAYNGDGPNCDANLKLHESLILVIIVKPTTDSTITACYYSGAGIKDPKPANDCATQRITVI